MKPHFMFVLSHILYCLINIIEINIKIIILDYFFKRQNFIKGKKQALNTYKSLVEHIIRNDINYRLFMIGQFLLM